MNKQRHLAGDGGAEPRRDQRDKASDAREAGTSAPVTHSHHASGQLLETSTDAATSGSLPAIQTAAEGSLDASTQATPAVGGDLWPGPRYAQLIEHLKTRIGESIHVSVFSFNGAFLKEGQPYRLLDVVPYPNPQSHSHPAKRAYPHMLILESRRPPDRDDIYWRNGVYHGGAINLAHIGSITTCAFPENHEDWIFGNLDLLSRYYGRPAAELLEEGLVPAQAMMMAPDSVWLTADDHSLLAGLLDSP
ncbi:MAG TPA: hypothetical protein VK979_01875 [Guyparkeria sp.]|nr:hypothetical protein [Guyparkeria sp.]